MNPFQRLSVVACLCLPAIAAGQHADVQLQVVDGQIVTGVAEVNEIDETTVSLSLGERVYATSLQSNFRTNNPGFNSTSADNPLLPAGVDAFAGGTEIAFDLMPVYHEEQVAPLFYWDALTTEVDFVLPPAGVIWNLFDNTGTRHTANPGIDPTPGGPIGTTASSGTLHQHRNLSVDDGDGNFQTRPDEGIYLASLRLRAEGLESSDPIFFVHRSRNISDTLLNQAAAWVETNYDSLIGLLPGDFNDDGMVDAADYTVWRDGLGTTYEPEDYDTWANNYGATNATPPAAASIPEPKSLIMLLAMSSLLGFKRSAREV